MRTNPQKRMLTIGTSIIGVAIALFIISRIYPYISGPRIQEISLAKQQYQEEYIVNIEAQLQHTQDIYINKNRISITDKGTVNHVLALGPGRNMIEIELHDTFNNSRIYTYEVITPPSEIIYPPGYTEEEITTEINTIN